MDRYFTVDFIRKTRKMLIFHICSILKGVDSGIGAGVDSFFEYLVKGSIMLNRPELLEIFHEAKSSIDKYLSRNDWHFWASMTKGQITIPVFQSLGMLSVNGGKVQLFFVGKIGVALCK